MATIRCKNVLFENVQAVLFDKDGTLARSEAFLRNLAQRRSRLIDAQIPGVQDPLLMAFGIENDQINPMGLMAVGTRQENEIAAAAYVAETGRGWIESLHLVRSAFVEADKYLPRKAEQTPLIDGAVDILQTLTQAGIKVGILSSDTTLQVQDFVQFYQLEPYIQVQLGVDDSGSKADAGRLQQLLSILQVSPAQILVVGDAATDVEVAHHLGAQGCIGFGGGWTLPLRLESVSVMIHQLSELAIDN